MGRWMPKIPDEIIFIAGIVFAIWSAFSFAAGAITCAEKKRCKYDTIAEWINPAYMISCELFEKRDW